MHTPLEVLCCYAHEDQEMLTHLKRHLIPLERRNQITIWSDTNINAGAKWEQELHQHLEHADIILLLISSYFIASDYCYSIEMERAIARHNEGSAVVIPILLRPALWQNTPLHALQMTPTNAKPITNWSDHDNAYHDIVRQIDQVVSKLYDRQAQINANTEQEIMSTTDLELLHGDNPPPTETLSPPRITRRKILVSGLVSLGIVGIAGAGVFHILPGSTNEKDKGASPTVQHVPTDVVSTTPTIYQLGGSSDLTSVTWSPDGQFIALGLDKTVHVLHVETGKKAFETNAQSSPILLVAWSPDGSKIASGCQLTSANQQGRVQVWNARDGTPITFLANEYAPLPWSFAWSPDGQKIVTSGVDATLDLWDATAGYNNREGYKGAVIGSPVAWSPDGSAIAASGSTTIDIWNPDTNELLSQYISGDRSSVLAWSHNGTYLAASSATTMGVWDTRNRKRLMQMKSGSLTDPILSIVWSPKNAKIATSGPRQNGVRIWKIEQNALLLDRSFSGATSVTWSPDGSKLALIRNGALEIWQSL